MYTLWVYGATNDRHWNKGMASLRMLTATVDRSRAEEPILSKNEEITENARLLSIRVPKWLQLKPFFIVSQ